MTWTLDAQRPAADTSSHRAEVEIVRGHARHPRRSVNGKVFVIGHSADCDLVLADRAFPETYVYLVFQPEGTIVRRAGDGPVLTLNGQAIGEQRVNDGDLLEFGGYAIRLHLQPAAALELCETKPSQHEPEAPAREMRSFGGKTPASNGSLNSLARAAGSYGSPRPAPLPPVDEVLGFPQARQKVEQLLADIAITVQTSPALRVYRGPERPPAKPIPRTTHYRATA